MTGLSRRGLLGAGVALLAAPALVRAGSLMPVSAPRAEWHVLTLDELPSHFTADADMAWGQVMQRIWEDMNRAMAMAMAEDTTRHEEFRLAIAAGLRRLA